MIREWLSVSCHVTRGALVRRRVSLLCTFPGATAVLRPTSLWSPAKFAHGRGPVLLSSCPLAAGCSPS